jgi:creatinine amidohydrolase
MADPDGARGGYSPFHETIADMTLPELQAEIAAGAVALWGLGVIEEHGPHLPLGTDAYLPHAQLRRVRGLLRARGLGAVLIPPFYWGVNHVTRSFVGSIHVRPEVMVELVADVLQSLGKDGFRAVFCISGQGDAAHNRALADGVRRGRAAGVDAYFVLGQAVLERLGLDPDPAFVTTPSPPPAGDYLDVHAGRWETSVMWAAYPDLVRADIVPTLRRTELTLADLAEWRKGGPHAVEKTPAGYLGDPAAADPASGLVALERDSAAIAEAIAGVIARRPQRGTAGT